MTAKKKDLYMLHYLQRLMHNMQHFSEKEFDILKYFYIHKKGHVRHIKKSSKLSEHTLLKYLYLLEKRKILTSRKEGNLKIYELNLQNPLTKIFFSFFDLQRLEGLEYKRKKAIKEFTNQIKDIKIPYFILLFGSTAKENYTEKSDIDLILVYDVFDKKINNQINEMRKKIFAETGVKISLILMKLSEFEREKENKENYALQDALEHGYPIFGNQIYYDILLK